MLTSQRCLAPFHSLDFVTPSLVSLGVYKIYNHRIEMVRGPEDERSVLWGSQPDAVASYLRHIDVEAILEEVVTKVRAPL
jgi:hypothetical protein